ncbi:MAG: BrnA antitoxin family protein, partial [Acidobacteria bacterium]|nr:BrnA antitoxin family protein [Acidobacteriota bacterium]
MHDKTTYRALLLIRPACISVDICADIWYNGTVVRRRTMPSTSIRIDEQALAVLRELARKQQQPVQTILKEAI